MVTALFDLNPIHNHLKQASIREANLARPSGLKAKQNIPEIHTETDSCYRNFTNAFQSSAVYPKKRTSKPWFGEDLYNLHGTLNQIYRIKPFQPKTYHEMKTRFKRIIKFKKKHYYQSQEIETISIAQTDKWQFWNALKPKKSTALPTQTHLYDLKINFRNLFHNPDPNIFETTGNTNAGNHDYCFSKWAYPFYFKENMKKVELLNQIHQTPWHKANGPESITYEVKKSCFYIVFTCFVSLFHIHLFRKEVIPSAWKIVTLILRDKTLRTVKINGKFYVCFIDIEKTSDTVERNLLLEKLISFGLHGKILQTMRAVCNTNYQYITANGHRYLELEQFRSVAQGEKLSPLLFSLHIADMHYYLQDHTCDVVFYTDDMASGGNNLETVQNCLNVIVLYCHRNALWVYLGKAEAVDFKRRATSKVR